MLGTLDAQGVFIYAEDDPVSPWSDYMNKGTRSISDQLAKSRFTPAASAAVRDEIFGTPFVEADRLALQAQGAVVVRTDTGWTEMYYATYHSLNNVQGLPQAGWYPIAGKLPSFHVRKGGPQNGGNSTWTVLNSIWGPPSISRGVGGFNFGALTIAQTGLYHVSAAYQIANNNVDGRRSIQVSRNTTSPDAAGMILKSELYGLSAIGTAFARLTTGDVLRVMNLVGNASAIGATDGDTYFDVNYLSPA
ncbi:hypothetical protein [Cryobacterium luteum]|uniref:Uncharacterized protein n=1 Tax=Cryobacterium luteum TaxID=1424661 RepID=A0A1H8ARR4_9MICO|nr:hypothetical protein [Cryobacterium luteum]TFB88611.1 hypothetical protein E3O10_12595 [Cryobacterium luteum]SEM73216.1 hypothetical protein SAMN05216281_101301 [Cryobacterium luteum]